MKRSELDALARDKKIKGYYKLKKKELINVLFPPTLSTTEAELSPSPRVENIMCTVNLGCKLDLRRIATHGCNVEYRPEKFNPVIMRLREPIKFSALIFTSGKIVSTGTKTGDEAKKSARIVARKIQKLGFPVRFINFRITNIVASADLGFCPRFTHFYYNNIKCSDYEPELFPGLIYRTDVTIIVFKSGKLIITNAKSITQINDAYEAFKKRIDKSTLSQGSDGI